MIFPNFHIEKWESKNNRDIVQYSIILAQFQLRHL